MLYSDYIMRLIEQLARAIARILGLKDENRFAEALDVLDRTVRNLWGLGLDAAETFSHKSLMTLISGEKPDAGEVAVLAELLKHGADLHELQGDYGKAHALYLKSLDLFLEACLIDCHLPAYPSFAAFSGFAASPGPSAAPASPGPSASSGLTALDGLVARAKSLGLPEDSRSLLVRYYSAAGRFSRAEDELYDWLDSSGTGRRAVGEGLAFYQDLLAKDDESLTRGNLPKDEVLAGLAELRQRAALS